MYVGFFSSNLIFGGQSLKQLVSGISIDWGIVISGVGSLLITVGGAAVLLLRGTARPDQADRRRGGHHLMTRHVRA
jgi:purine-cytosine permease-like protein